MAILRTGDVESLQDFLSNTADTDSALSAVLTFDDGNLSDYTLAFPLLLELGVPAQFFVNTATVDTPGHLSWSQLREMSEHGMGIGSHAHDHRYLTQCDLGELNRQLSLSKKTIEERVGREVSFLAVPYGDYNRRVITSVKEVGYRAICTGRSWPARWASEVIDRTIVHGFTSQVEFEKLFSRDLFTYGRRAARAAIISLPKQVWLQLRFRGWNPRGEEVLS
jgi:peptidoglycan/xylan/chitin deacetylase (PgdA/CDA1 family)